MKRYLLVLTTACFTLAIQAQTRTEREMQAIAAEHLYGQMSSVGSSSRRSSTLTAKPEKLMQNDMVAAYGDHYNGTVFVSRDACFAPVLGYTDRPLQMESLPDGLQWWLQTISETMKQKKLDNDIRTIHKAEAQEVQPLLTTKWAQDAPFNNQCPVADNWSKKRAQTGCVATAMAQVMKHHEYPGQGQGTGYYTVNGSSSKKNVRIKTVYDWANMKDKYSENTSEDETTDAVASLMFDCGVAAHMAYALQGSGAAPIVAAAGLVNHFTYDSLALHCSFRVLDNDDRWLQTIYSELQAQRPVLYGSTDANYGAHAFVIDGCKADNGYVHVNWGWAGEADGYFDFFNLNPKTAYQQAYGMAGYDFSSDAASQSMMTGIMPPDGTERPYESYWAMADEDDITVLGDSITLHLPTMINYHYLTFYGLVGLCIENVKTGHAPIQPFYYTAWGENPISSLAGWNTMEIPYYKQVTDQLEDGEYDLYLMSWNQSQIGKTNPQYVRFPDLNDGNENYNVWRMTKKDGHLTIQKNKVPLVPEEKPTSVSSPIARHSASNNTYDLQGHLVSRREHRLKVGEVSNLTPRSSLLPPRKGIYIINGKKYINQ